MYLLHLDCCNLWVLFCCSVAVKPGRLFHRVSLRPSHSFSFFFGHREQKSLQVFVSSWYSFKSIPVFNACKCKSPHARHLKNGGFWFLWKTLTQVLAKHLPNQFPALCYVTTMVPGQYACNPREAGTKMATLETVLETGTHRAVPYQSCQASQWKHALSFQC